MNAPHRPIVLAPIGFALLLSCLALCDCRSAWANREGARAYNLSYVRVVVEETINSGVPTFNTRIDGRISLLNLNSVQSPTGQTYTPLPTGLGEIQTIPLGSYPTLERAFASLTGQWQVSGSGFIYDLITDQDSFPFTVATVNPSSLAIDAPTFVSPPDGSIVFSNDPFELAFDLGQNPTPQAISVTATLTSASSVHESPPIPMPTGFGSVGISSGSNGLSFRTEYRTDESSELVTATIEAPVSQRPVAAEINIASVTHLQDWVLSPSYGRVIPQPAVHMMYYSAPNQLNLTAPVPEPNTAALFCLACLGAAVTHRRSHRAR